MGAHIVGTYPSSLYTLLTTFDMSEAAAQVGGSIFTSCMGWMDGDIGDTACGCGLGLMIHLFCG